jgi:hypothetical protein
MYRLREYIKTLKDFEDPLGKLELLLLAAQHVGAISLHRLDASPEGQRPFYDALYSQTRIPPVLKTRKPLRGAN